MTLLQQAVNDAMTEIMGQREEIIRAFIAQQATTQTDSTQTPFEKFKAAASQVFTVPKSALPPTPKKPAKS